MHTRGLPSFGPHGCVKPYCCFVVCIAFLLGGAECYSTLEQLTRPSVSGFLLPPTLRMGLLLYAKGVTNRWQCRQGQNGKSVVLGTAACTVLSYLTRTAGDKGIKCPSVSPKQCRKGTVRGATVCHDG